MLNSYTSNTIKINAVTGAILKNHPKSWFERFHLNSSRAKSFLTEGGHSRIIILQMVVCGDMEVIAECVYVTDLIPKERGEKDECNLLGL